MGRSHLCNVSNATSLQNIICLQNTTLLGACQLSKANAFAYTEERKKAV